MYSILNELAGIDRQLPDNVDDPADTSEVEIYRIDDNETDSTDQDDHSCECPDEDSCECDGDDPVEDLVDRFRDWLTQNVDVERLSSDDDSEPVEYDDIEVESDRDGVENEEPTDDLNGDLTGPEESEEDLSGVEGDLGDGPDELEHPDKQGMIRVVKGAHLVYKRKSPDGFYEELWMFNIGKDAQRDEMEVRSEILSGTDIPESSTRSEDGAQYYELRTSGNGQMMKIVGLPN